MNKPIRLHVLVIIIRCVFSEGGKFYPQLFLDDASYEMLQYEKIDVSEGIDIDKTSASEECELFHYFFLKMLDLNLKSMFVIDVMIY